MENRLAARGAIMTAVAIAFASSVFSPVALLSWTGLPHVDKVGHVMAYGALTLCLSAAPMSAVWSGVTSTVVLLMLPVGLGLTCEWIQDYIPGRSPDPWDLAANGLGMLIGITAPRVASLLMPWRRHTGRRHQPFPAAA